MSKKKIIIFLTSILLILAIGLGIVSQMSDTIINSNQITANTTKPNDENMNNPDENVPGDNTGNTNTKPEPNPEPEPEPEPNPEPEPEPEYQFSGKLLKKIDLSQSYHNSYGHPLYSNYISSSNGSHVTTETSNGWFNCIFDYSNDNTTVETGGSHFAFGVSPTQNFHFMDYDYEYFTVDMDISISNVHEIFSFYSNSTGSNGYSTGSFKFYGKMNETGSRISFWSTSEGANSILYEISDDYFHLTAIYQIDINNTANSLVHFYINGDYVCSGKPFKEISLKYYSFRIHFPNAAFTSSGTYSVKNIEFYVFEDPNHESMLAKAVNDKTNLKYCPDSVLYEGK